MTTHKYRCRRAILAVLGILLFSACGRGKEDAVTGNGGSFEITGLPAGDHVVEVWHEILGKQTKTVKLGANETATVIFEFAGS